MRHTQPANRETWAPYVANVLENAKARRTTVTAIANHVDVDRSTLYRWARAIQVPETRAQVLKFAEAAGDAPAVALKAAGMLSEDEERIVVEWEEPAIDIIRQSSLTPEMKESLIQDVLEQSAEDRDRRRRYVENLLKTVGRTGLSKP